MPSLCGEAPAVRKPQTWADALWLVLTALLVLWANVNGYLALTLSAAALALLFGTVLLPLSDEAIRAKAARIREALRLADISPSKAALYIYGRDGRESDFVKALKCERTLDTWKLERLPADFHRYYALLELRDRGLPDYARTFVKIAAAVERKEQRA